MQIPNPYNAPECLWNSFTSEGKLRFNNVMQKSLPDQAAFLGPFSVGIERAQWQTICWNFACLAAWNHLEGQSVRECAYVHPPLPVNHRLLHQGIHLN